MISMLVLVLTQQSAFRASAPMGSKLYSSSQDFPLSSMLGLPSYEEAEVQRSERVHTGKRGSGDTKFKCKIRLPIQNRAVNEEVMTPFFPLHFRKMKMKKGRLMTMSEPDLADRFGHIGLRF